MTLQKKLEREYLLDQLMDHEPDVICVCGFEYHYWDYSPDTNKFRVEGRHDCKAKRIISKDGGMKRMPRYSCDNCDLIIDTSSDEHYHIADKYRACSIKCLVGIERRRNKEKENKNGD